MIELRALDEVLRTGWQASESVVIVMDSPLDFVTRTAQMYRHLSCPVDLDLLVYTPEEMQRRSNNPFITRYPNGLPDGIPADVYTEEAATGAVGLAREVVEFVEANLGSESRL